MLGFKTSLACYTACDAPSYQHQAPTLCSPESHVSLTLMLSIFIGSTFVGSFSRTVSSAYLPTTKLPQISSRQEFYYCDDECPKPMDHSGSTGPAKSSAELARCIHVLWRGADAVADATRLYCAGISRRQYSDDRVWPRPPS